jgi:hypothetical protein
VCDVCCAGVAVAEARTCSPIPSCVDVRAVVGFDTTLTGDVATVVVANAAWDELRFRLCPFWYSELKVSVPGDDPSVDADCFGERFSTEFCDCTGDADAVVIASIDTTDSRFPGTPDSPPVGEDMRTAPLVIAFPTMASAAGVDIVGEAVNVLIVAVPGARDTNRCSDEDSKTLLPFGTLLEKASKVSRGSSVMVGTGSDAIVAAIRRFFFFFVG